jgi:hypothetical protein
MSDETVDYAEFREFVAFADSGGDRVFARAARHRAIAMLALADEGWRLSPHLDTLNGDFAALAELAAARGVAPPVEAVDSAYAAALGLDRVARLWDGGKLAPDMSLADLARTIDGLVTSAHETGIAPDVTRQAGRALACAVAELSAAIVRAI